MPNVETVRARWLVCGVIAVLAACGGSSGGNQTYSARITSGGGQLVGPGGVLVVVPAGAVASDFVLTIATLPGATPPSGSALAATPLRIAPKAQTFGLPVTITVPIADAQLPAGAAIGDVVVMMGDADLGTYVPLTTRVAGPAVVVDTIQLGDFVAVVPGADAGVPLDASTPTDASAAPDAGVDAGTVAPRVVANGDGTVTELATALMWEATPVTTPVTLADATAQCTALSTGGLTDWRLPTVQEFVQFVDFTRFNPAFDTSVFPATPNDEAWTATPVAGTPTSNWTAYLWTGAYLAPMSAAGATAIAWCVRGTTTVPAPVFVDNLDGTVTDNGSGLTWQQVPSATAMTIAAGQTHCQTLSLGTPGAWRLPEIRELFRIAAYDRQDPAIDTAFFTSGAAVDYWSATPSPGSPGYNWFWNSSLGTANALMTTSFRTIRCVR